MSDDPSNPMLYIVAGANGAGKSTWISRYLHGLSVLDWDAIASKYSGQDKYKGYVASLPELKQTVKNFFDGGKSFAWGTLLSGTLTADKFIKRAKERQYRVCLVYVFVKNVKYNIERVKMRAKKGGHSREEQNIRSDYTSSLRNFDKISKKVNYVRLIYSIQNTFTDVAFWSGGVAEVYDKSLYNLFENNRLQALGCGVSYNNRIVRFLKNIFGRKCAIL